MVEVLLVVWIAVVAHEWGWHRGWRQAWETHRYFDGTPGASEEK